MEKAQETKNKVADLIQKGKEQPMDNVILAVKIIQILSAVLLVAAAVLRMGSVQNFRSWYGFLLTGYLFLFGVIFLLVEFAMLRAPIYFFYLNFMWGKAIAYLFIAGLQLWSSLSITWIDVLAGLWFLIFGVLFIVFCGVYRMQEWDRVERIVEAIEAGEVIHNRPNLNVGDRKEQQAPNQV